MLGMIDPARPEVIEAVSKCNTAGIRPVMITGDHKSTAMAIAREIGIFREGDSAITGMELEKLDNTEFTKNVSRYTVYARVAPEHKVRIVKAWQSHGEVVAMTGDGINDAPALATADLGIAIGTGTDVAIETAGITLVSGDLRGVGAAIRLSKRTMRTIRQNLFWAFVYNCVGIPLAAFGVLTPVFAGAAMALSSVSVVSNALLLKRFRPRAEFEAHRAHAPHAAPH